MSVRELTPPPSPRTLLGIIDVKARESVAKSKEDIGPVVRRETPRKSGELERGLQPRVSRTSTGFALTVAPTRGRRHGNITLAELVRHVTKGTGVYREGPGPKHRIRAKNPLRRMNLGNGVERYSVRGQRPNPFMSRIEAAGTSRFERNAEEYAHEAAWAVQRAI